MDFGTYLKTARQERRIGLDAVAAATKIKHTLLIELEANDVSRWPAQAVYRHGFIRAYAKAVGLNPDDLVRRFDAEFSVEQLHAAVPATVPKPTPSWFMLNRRPAVAAIAGGLVLGVAVSTIDRARRTDVQVLRSSPRASNIRLQPEERPASSAESEPAAVPAPATNSGAAFPQEDVPPHIEGEIRTVSTPPEAWVTVNDIGYGSTPLRVQFLPLRSYVVRLIHPGYRIGETHVTLTPDRPKRTVSVALRSNPSLAGVRANTRDAAADRASYLEP